MSDTGKDWIDATEAASQAMELAKRTAAVQRAHTHLTMLMLATLAKTAPPEAVDQLLGELERVRDMTGPAGAAAGEVFATAVSTLERFARHS
jgi:hypothetical protein